MFATTKTTITLIPLFFIFFFLLYKYCLYISNLIFPFKYSLLDKTLFHENFLENLKSSIKNTHKCKFDLRNNQLTIVFQDRNS